MDMIELLRGAQGILGKHSGEVNVGNLAGSVLGMLSKENGGIGSMVEQFQSNGLGDVAKSWISTGQNQPITEDELTKVFGPQKLGAMANEAGMDLTKFLPILTAVLPMIVDKLTPDGEVNDKSNSMLDQGMGLLSMFMKK